MNLPHLHFLKQWENQIEIPQPPGLWFPTPRIGEQNDIFQIHPFSFLLPLPVFLERHTFPSCPHSSSSPWVSLNAFWEPCSRWRLMENNISYQINRLSLAHTRLHRMANIISAQEGEGMELRISMKWDETQNIKFILKCVCGERGGCKHFILFILHRLCRKWERREQILNQKKLYTQWVLICQ